MRLEFPNTIFSDSHAGIESSGSGSLCIDRRLKPSAEDLAPFTLETIFVYTDGLKHNDSNVNSQCMLSFSRCEGHSILTEMDQGNSLSSASMINISGSSFTDVHHDLIVSNRGVTVNNYSTSSPGASIPG